MALCAPLGLFALAKFADESLNSAVAKALAKAADIKADLEQRRLREVGLARAIESDRLDAVQREFTARLAMLATEILRADSALDDRAKKAAMVMDRWKSHLEGEMNKALTANGNPAPPRLLILGRIAAQL
ncbi:hypothetical protein [Novosphingobium aquae]|uniref:Uncharacterized protein n=1 Tax=Novosphingobium aquae TaxID=3133435 RepID=A0ABU8SC20_9SPHN